MCGTPRRTPLNFCLPLSSTANPMPPGTAEEEAGTAPKPRRLEMRAAGVLMPALQFLAPVRSAPHDRRERSRSSRLVAAAAGPRRRRAALSLESTTRRRLRGPELAAAGSGQPAGPAKGPSTPWQAP
eukprot:tig00001535_g9290.t1